MDNIFQHEDNIRFLLSLEQRGIAVSIRGSRLAVTGQLTTADEAAIVANRSMLFLLVACSDPSVLARRREFERALAGPNRRFLTTLPDDAIVDDPRRCYSCGDALARQIGGRCWRCQLAARLACRAPIEPDLRLHWTVADEAADRVPNAGRVRLNRAGTGA